MAKYIINGTEISVTGYMVCKGDKNKGEEDQGLKIVMLYFTCLKKEGVKA